MQVLRSQIALLLLLCLTRTLLPEAWILALHAHAHTVVEPAQAPTFGHRGKALVSARHQHCAVEQFYNAAFQAAGPLSIPLPRVAPRYAALPAPRAVRAEAGGPRRHLTLRGPPRRA